MLLMLSGYAALFLLLNHLLFVSGISPVSLFEKPMMIFFVFYYLATTERCVKILRDQTITHFVRQWIVITAYALWGQKAIFLFSALLLESVTDVIYAAANEWKLPVLKERITSPFVRKVMRPDDEVKKPFCIQNTARLRFIGYYFTNGWISIVPFSAASLIRIAAVFIETIRLISFY